MKYIKKHKNLIAKLFKKAGMAKEAATVLSCDQYKYEISHAMRDAAAKANVGIGGNPELLDAARRYETRDCAILRSAPCRVVRAAYGAKSIISAAVTDRLAALTVIWEKEQAIFHCESAAS